MSKLLAVDLDGTLVRRDGTIDPRDRDAIAGVRARGIAVALVTGRLSAGTLPVAAELELDGLHACADGAALVAHPSGEVRELATIPTESRALLRELLASVPGPSFLLTSAAVLYDATGQGFLPYLSSWSPDLRPVHSVVDDPLWQGLGPTNTVTIGPRHDLDRMLSRLRAETGLTLLTFDASTHPGTGVVVTRPPGQDKGHGIRRLAALGGHSADQVVAVGDWLNDVAMFRAAGRSFAVPGCPDALSQVATDRLQTAGGHGAVAEAIARVWG